MVYFPLFDGPIALMTDLDSLSLNLLTLDDRDRLFRLVDSNREFLRQWLPWVDSNRTADDTQAFLVQVEAQHRAGKGPQYAIERQGELCGVCGFHTLDARTGTGSIGYWLGERFGGQGIMTRAVQQLVAEGFETWGMRRIEIACAVENYKSRAIPERLGFMYEGVIPEREWLNGRYVDHAMYSLLASESQPDHKVYSHDG